MPALPRKGGSARRFQIVHTSRPESGGTPAFAAVRPVTMMILDIARLLLFPALMAFAAASDLFTMTISNRVSLALVGGFLGLAVLGGMGLADIMAHVAAGAAILAVAFACF